MKLDIAKKFVEGLQAAIEQAEAEGRAELNTGDISTFAAMDDDARAELNAVIENAKESG